MTRILAIDTATEACSAALWQNGELLSRYQVAPRGHTDLILPMVAELLAEGELSLNQLDGLAFGRGPGSFTGVRITLGVAQGLAYGADVPLLGVSNLQALAQGAHRACGGERVLSAIDARMGEIYVGAYRLEQGLMVGTIEERVLAPAQFLDSTDTGTDSWQLGVGSGFVTYAELMSRVEGRCEAVPFPEARDLLPQAIALWQAGLGVAAADARPVYLRDKVTWQKLPGR
ncbi:tRNA (adenosine(37)-N6)-threonylcarbamoyltransferase complex dimerization subunit type 1 TsaB [Oceanisphaera sp. KMM 10153]|uniref:tRNA (adenosine(37)-N6)-threonylcarbamoyltransferase complex dimerization subunit type 1 TsaB n=1 Tax=Oceanisphaera submarina TaxID=3390193 RepID=UPI003976F93F